MRNQQKNNLLSFFTVSEESTTYNLLSFFTVLEESTTYNLLSLQSRRNQQNPLTIYCLYSLGGINKTHLQFIVFTVSEESTKPTYNLLSFFTVLEESTTYNFLSFFTVLQKTLTIYCLGRINKLTIYCQQVAPGTQYPS